MPRHRQPQSDARGCGAPADSAILNLVVHHTTIDRTFAALADPTRRAIVERLGGSGSATIGELAAPFGITLTGMKKHVAVLESAGIVTTTKVGRARRCALVPRPLAHIDDWLKRLDRFEELLERTKGDA